MPRTASDAYVAIYERLNEVLAEFEITDDDIAPDTELRADLDIDSAELVEIVAAVAVDQAPEGKQLSAVATVGQLVQLLEAQNA
ncbi:MAG: phosphopantetheine-binding protein [Chloroflexi bacterium]|nr:phosphopantetheine-binding protein [Chloroflexota bacterium]